MRTSVMRAPRLPNDGASRWNSKISRSLRRQRRRACRLRGALNRLEEILEVELADAFGRSDRLHASCVEPDRAIAQARHRDRVVADEEQRSTLFELPQETHALLHEARVADRERLVDDQNLGIDVRHHREGEAHRHSGRVSLDRLLNEFADVGEAADRVIARLDLLPRQTDDVAV